MANTYNYVNVTLEAMAQTYGYWLTKPTMQHIKITQLFWIWIHVTLKQLILSTKGKTIAFNTTKRYNYNTCINVSFVGDLIRYWDFMQAVNVGIFQVKVLHKCFSKTASNQKQHYKTK